MDLLLKVLGVLALVLLGLLLLVLGLVCWKWKLLKLALRSTRGIPSTISLIEDPDPKWLQKPIVQQAQSDLTTRGFERAGPFLIEGLPGCRVVGFTHPSRDIRVCVYEHDVIGNWIDICATLLDGTELTIGSAKQGSEMDTRPGTEKVLLPGKAVGELFVEFDRRVADRGVKPGSGASFQDDFVADYARDMAWRNNQAGISWKEFQRVAERDGKKYSPELLKEAFKETKLGELRRWESECVAELEKTSSIPVSQWREYEGHMVLFRDDFHPEAYVDYLSDTIELSDEALKRHKQAAKEGVGVKQLLEHIASEAGAPCTRLGEVTAPIRAEIYGVRLTGRSCHAHTKTDRNSTPTADSTSHR